MHEGCSSVWTMWRPANEITTHLLNLISCFFRHEYHKTCIDPWLLEHRTCPICKMDILKHYGFIVSSTHAVYHIYMHMWFYFFVTRFSHSEHCYVRRKRSVLFNNAVNFWDCVVSMGDDCNEYGALIKKILTGENRSTWRKPVLVPLFSTSNLSQTGLELLCLKHVNLSYDASSLYHQDDIMQFC